MHVCAAVCTSRTSRDTPATYKRPPRWCRATLRAKRITYAFWIRDRCRLARCSASLLSRNVCLRLSSEKGKKREDPPFLSWNWNNEIFQVFWSIAKTDRKSRSRDTICLFFFFFFVMRCQNAIPSHSQSIVTVFFAAFESIWNAREGVI